MNYYPLDVWESVLKDLGFSFIDERVSSVKGLKLAVWQTTQDCSILSKSLPLHTDKLSKQMSIKMWFDRKTQEIYWWSIEIQRSSSNDYSYNDYSYNEHIPVEQFIDFYKDRFRHYLIEKIL